MRGLMEQKLKNGEKIYKDWQILIWFLFYHLVISKSYQGKGFDEFNNFSIDVVCVWKEA